MSDEQKMPEVIYASDSSCGMVYGKWWRSKELDHYTPYLRCPDNIDPADAVVVSKAHEDMDALSIAYMKGKRRGQALSRATIATLTAELEKHRELVEAVQKAISAWESHNFDGTPEAVAMERAMGRCEDIIRQGQTKEQDDEV